MTQLNGLTTWGRAIRDRLTQLLLYFLCNSSHMLFSFPLVLKRNEASRICFVDVLLNEKGCNEKA